MNYPDSNDLYQGKFTDGDPLVGRLASVASADHMNAIYDELKALITAGGLAPDFNDLAQVSQSVGSQLRSKRLFDVSGTANAILLTTPAGKQPVTTLNDYDEFSFIVSETNTGEVTISIDGLDAFFLSGVVTDTQIFETALLTVRYIAGSFHIADQINPKTGNSVLDIAKLYTDTVDVLAPGEYVLDGSEISSIDHPIACAKAAASSNYIAQATKDADPITYGGFYGFVDELDGVTTVTLPIVGGEFVRMFDDGRGVDDGRAFGSWQEDTMQQLSGSLEIGYNYREAIQKAGGVFFGSAGGGSVSVNSDSGVSDDKQLNFDASRVARTSDENRPRNIAYYGKTRL
ncbi:MAG: hypothetical protein HWE14_12265 [Flavobacteriia bacterium]|nr:hypothetical protein [Flavobacteriia bacterium]